jgi:hypothetical protein
MQGKIELQTAAPSELLGTARKPLQQPYLLAVLCQGTRLAAQQHQQHQQDTHGWQQHAA